MQTIFSNIGYKTTNNSQSKKIEVFVISNPDGSPRWIIPTSCKSPLFLKFYNVNNYKSLLISNFFSFTYKLGLKKFLLKKQSFQLEKTENAIFDLSLSNWALFTGTPGPNNKIVVYEELPNETLFHKIATTETSKKIINQEKEVLQRLEKTKTNYCFFPKVVHSGDNFVSLEDISKEGSRFSELDDLLLNSIQEISSIENNWISFDDFQEKLNLKNSLKQIQSDFRIPFGIQKKLNWLLSYFDDENIETNYSHGDFTPWNIFKSNKKAGVYDWELATSDHPMGFDAFHFIFQQNILIKRSSWLSLREEIYDRIQEKNIQKWSKNNEISINKYLSLYLLTNTIHYLEIYSRQEKWHEQIHWLIDTWNQGVSDILKMTKSNRELLILDLFDFLKTKQYGALKFPDISPEKLSEFSDIDLCILKSDHTSIINFIENHPLISDYTTSSKSYMSSLNIQLIDGGNLSLDLIWKFKRTKWVFLNASELLKKCHPNKYGVKIPSNEKLARYIGLFYGLNGAAVPEKYLHFQEYLSHSPIDAEIKRHYVGEKKAVEKLYHIIKTRKENRGIYKYWNLAQYCSDTFKQLMKSKGIILTFSGVDGAGKSTIIEHVKEILEKKFRKRVVVIRHRPSILPILSAITKGKEQAEKDAASTLPRQGTNQNKLSSFVRFMYYYVDYLFGQIYINFKYKYRGYVVLYDRYYYDFILDSKRSNIVINPSIVRFGYRFVYTPDLNFFLYADPDVILKRKQELSAETIMELTKKYKNLFSNYENRKLNKNYHSINNIELQDTLDYITLEINRKLN